MNKWRVKCPVCHERGVIDQADVGDQHVCPNCQKTVVMVPETSRRRMLRQALPFCIGLVLLLIAWWAIMADLKMTTESLSR